MSERDASLTATPLSRRGFIGLATAGAAGLVLGGLPGRAAAHTGTVAWHNEIWNQPTYLPDTGAPWGTYWDPTFYSRYETWLSFYWGNTPGNWLTPMRVWHGRVHDDGAGTKSWHYYGRACDQFNLDMTVNGVMTKVFDAKYKSGSTGWSYLTGSALTTARNRYWGAVASLNYHFADVLHYWFTPTYFSDAVDYSHQWHVHADNGHSGSGNSVFAPSTSGRRVQVFTVQSCLRYIWGYAPTMDGIWGPQTQSMSDAILANMGLSGHLTSSQANWLAFLRAATRWGTGSQTSWGGGGGGCLTALSGPDLKQQNAIAAAIPC